MQIGISKGFCRFRKAFTLSEVLITLGIIGVVAAMTLPVLINNYKSKVLREEFKVAYSELSQFLVKVQADWGTCPDCFYWDLYKNPYSGNTKCTEKNDKGDCLKFTMQDGSEIPEDYYGRHKDCNRLMNEIPKQFEIAKICDGNALKDGCITDILGVDTVKQKNDPNVTDEEAAKSTGNCSFFRENYLHNQAIVYVLKNGITIIPYDKRGSGLWLVDINGKKGPNKWGYDLFALSFAGDIEGRISIQYGRCSAVEKGGFTPLQMIQTMHNK